MTDLLLFAAKSTVIVGASLVLLSLVRNRSASHRSWIAHLGLAALLALPLVSFLLPAMEIATPAWRASEAMEAASARANSAGVNKSGSEDTTTWLIVAYAIPAMILLLSIPFGLSRLVLLKRRAVALVDSHWLEALDQAEQRMGIKSGAMLFTSDELSSPVSWGLMRPVILLNSDAIAAQREAEVIIAHELAHFARWDWVKLTLSRIVTALFWFNPLVWMLACEAHQLREEAADDAVLATDVEDTCKPSARHSQARAPQCAARCTWLGARTEFSVAQSAAGA